MTSRELVYEQTTPGIVKHPPEELSVSEPRSGPAAAVVLAAGIGCFTLGLLSVLVAASGRVSEALTLSERVGDVSGLTTATALVFFAAWGALSLVWRRSDPALMRVALASGGLVALGLLGTFPPFFNAIG
jgi:hypothetical protein